MSTAAPEQTDPKPVGAQWPPLFVSVQNMIDEVYKDLARFQERRDRFARSLGSERLNERLLTLVHDCAVAELEIEYWKYIRNEGMRAKGDLPYKRIERALNDARKSYEKARALLSAEERAAEKMALAWQKRADAVARDQQRTAESRAARIAKQEERERTRQEKAEKRRRRDAEKLAARPSASSAEPQAVQSTDSETQPAADAPFALTAAETELIRRLREHLQKKQAAAALQESPLDAQAPAPTPSEN